MSNTNENIETAVVIVSYNCTDDTVECIESLLASDDTPAEKRILVVDNSPNDELTDIFTQKFPSVELIRPGKNLGFAGGCNFGWKHLREKHPTLRYLAILNPDTTVQSGWLIPLIEQLKKSGHTGAVQSRVMLHHDREKLDTAGNRSHFLGFGFTTGHNQPVDERYNKIRTIDFPSGAAFAIRRSVLDAVDLFDSELFMYLEDVELGWKITHLGYITQYIPDSVIYHKHKFQGTLKFYYYLERNRWSLLLSYYRIPTLLLLAPALILMEFGQLYFAIQNKILDQKIKSYTYFLNPSTIRWLYQKRIITQERRNTCDREFMGSFSGTIDFPELNKGLMKSVGNPILNFYWKTVRHLIFW